MKLVDILLLSLAVALLIIGIHQTMTLGIVHSYWILMLSMASLIYYQIRKKPKT
ncbi:MAG TPA: hypothetical protein PKC24_11495 [Cyclobacteriaceae bacterium]|nr:hypothetical protein [Cyclobacteriaceae bacterium]